MKRLIDAEDLKKEIKSAFSGKIGLTVTGAIHEIIDRQPTIDPESLRPTAHWEGFQADGKDDRFEFTLNAINICSKCKHISMQKSKYCSNCGAKMEG